MDEFEETDNYSIITDYDDGVVCFGTVTQSQIERLKKLPRRTVVPSDFKLSESFVNSKEFNEDNGNDQTVSLLDKSGKNTTISIDDSINEVTEATNFPDNKEVTDMIKLKQSSTNDSLCVFSSPCGSRFIPSEKLIDTETINRYIRMRSLSPNETFSEDQNKSTFCEDGTIIRINDQEVKLSTKNCAHSETSLRSPSVSSVIEQSTTNIHKLPDRDDNVCTLKHCDLQEDEDLSYYCDSELEDIDEYSIVTDKYSITPGKQRLFDLRHAKSSIRAKNVVGSAPFMDRIEETTSPLPKALNSPSMLNHDISYEPLENKENLDRTSVSSFDRKSSGVHFNQTSGDWDLKSKKSIDETVGELSKSPNFNNSVSEDDNINCVNYRTSASPSYDSIVEKAYENKLTLTNNITINDTDMPLTVVNETFVSISNTTEQIFNTDKSLNDMSNFEVYTEDINDYNDEKVSETVLTEIKSTNNSVVDTTFNETLSTSMFLTNIKSKDIDKSWNETSQTKDISDQSFDIELSVSRKSDIFSRADINGFNNKECEAMEVDMKSANTSVVDKLFNETIITSVLCSNGKSEDLNKSTNETSLIKDTSYVSNQSFDIELSVSRKSDIFSRADINGFNNEECEAMEVDMKSANTSVVDKLFNETIITSVLCPNGKSEDLNKSTTSLIKDTSYVSDQNFDIEKSISNISNIISAVDVTDYSDEKTLDAKEIDVKSVNTSVEDKIFNKTISTSLLPPNDKIINLNKSSNETSQAEVVLNNVAEHSFNDEKSSNNIVISSDIEVPKSKNVDVVSFDEISETNENNSENLSGGMRQFLEFEQTIYNMCNDISSVKSDKNINKSNISGDQLSDNISMIEQILCSDSFISMKDDDNFSSSENSLRPKLSVIIENRTLEENCSDIEQNEHLRNPSNDTTIISPIKETIIEIQDDIKLNKFTDQNKIVSIISEDISKFELNDKDDKFEVADKSNEGNFIINNIDSELLLNENNDTTCVIPLDVKLDKIEHCENVMVNDELLKKEPCILAKMEDSLKNNMSKEDLPVSEDVKEMSLNQNTSNKNDLQSILIQENMIDNFDLNAIKSIPESGNINTNSFNPEQNAFLNNDVQQLNVFNTNKNIHDRSLDEYNKLEQMCYSEEGTKLQTFDYKTPKIEKLLDFSIMQQTPTFENQAKKQKLLNFSIVDQTPIKNSTQPIDLDENAIEKKDTLIDFSTNDQMWDLNETSCDKPVIVDFKDDFLSSSKDSLSKNLSEISAPDVELLVDESVITNISNHNNSSLDQTITDTNLNLSKYSSKINESKQSIDSKNIEETNVKLLDNDYCSMMLINKDIKTDEPSSSVDKTSNQIDLVLTYSTDSKQNKLCNELFEHEATTGAIHQSTYSPNTTLNQSFKNSDSAEFIMNTNQQPTVNTNLCAIKDFSIIEEQISQRPRSKENTNNISDWNVSNLIEMSVVSKNDTESNNQIPISSDNHAIIVTSDNKSEKSINSSSDEINNTAIHFEEHIFSHNREFLTDIQMNDISLVESSEKSSVTESFHSIESDQLLEDNKRKSEPEQEYRNLEKKLKIGTEEPKTPMSMLYKLRNMFKSSEKPSISKNNSKENYVPSNKCHQKLNLSLSDEIQDKSICYKKPEVLSKSKIPCKISDKSMNKNCEFNNSSSSLNDSIKPKKAIPRFIGTPVLSDVSNSSIRKCTESRIPSKFKK